MPTYDELNELRTKCTWTWTTKNGVNGYVVSGKGAYSGASIFLPAAGYGNGYTLDYAGSSGYYWASVPGSGSYSNSWTLYFHSSDRYGYRYYGYPVRPVLDVH